MKSHSVLWFVSVFALLAGCAADTTQPVPNSIMSNEAPGPDTTFYQDVSWSPDGEKLLLSRLDIHDAYRHSLSVVNIDGTDYTRITMGPADMWASWSPDGTQIAYGSSREDNRDIYLMKPDGSDPIRLTSDPGEDMHPDWSPDGSKLVFVSKRDGHPHLYVMNADGSEQTRISHSLEEKYNPQWAPDGGEIIYYGTAEPGKDSVYVMNVDGSEKKALTAGVWPFWSPDGSSILFVSDKTVFQMSMTGGTKNRVLNNAVIARWSPDGRKLAFVRNTWAAESGWPATTDVFIVNADGSGMVKVTHRQ